MTGNDLTQAAKLLNDPLWRLNNLYWIIDKSGNKALFRLNWAQERLYHDMWYCNIILKARQLGISTFGMPKKRLKMDGVEMFWRCGLNRICIAGKEKR